MIKYMTLPIKGFMQHYSSKSQQVKAPSSVYYKTEEAPTKSAVVGMIGAALGISRSELDKLGKLYDTLDIKYRLIKRGLIDTDYQTVRPLHKNEKFKSVDGKQDDSAIIKTIEYLFDYEFEVYVGSSDENLLQDIREAFERPVYPPYLGKRSCVAPRLMFLEGFTEMEGKDNVYDCA